MVGVLIGLVHRSPGVARVGIPSFVVTLATFLAYQGVLLWIIGDGRHRPDHRTTSIFAMSNGNMPVLVGWIVVIGSIAAYAALNLLSTNGAGRPTW